MDTFREVVKWDSNANNILSVTHSFRWMKKTDCWKCFVIKVVIRVVA